MPLLWWMRMVKQTPAPARSPMIDIWLDQVMHITVLVGLSLWLGWYL